MTKPFMGVSASGCHTNMSLWTGGKDKVNKLGHKSLPGMDEVFSYVEGGTNTFMPDTKDVQLPGKIGLKSIGGVMKHLPASIYREHSNYLDVGCGTGQPFRFRLSKALTDSSKYIATDISISALRFNRSVNDHKNSLYIVASADCLPFKNSVIDTITYFGILHHAERQADTVPENADFLKPGGAIIIQEAIKRFQPSSFLPYLKV